MDHPSLFSVYFRLFKQMLQSLHEIYVKKCPPSRQWQDSNPQTLVYEYPPKTTRPGLPPSVQNIFTQKAKSTNQEQASDPNQYFIYISLLSVYHLLSSMLVYPYPVLQHGLDTQPRSHLVVEICIQQGYVPTAPHFYYILQFLLLPTTYLFNCIFQFCLLLPICYSFHTNVGLKIYLILSVDL